MKMKQLLQTISGTIGHHDFQRSLQNRLNGVIGIRIEVEVGSHWWGKVVEVIRVFPSHS